MSIFILRMLETNAIGDMTADIEIRRGPFELLHPEARDMIQPAYIIEALVYNPFTVTGPVVYKNRAMIRFETLSGIEYR